MFTTYRIEKFRVKAASWPLTLFLIPTALLIGCATLEPPPLSERTSQPEAQPAGIYPKTDEADVASAEGHGADETRPLDLAHCIAIALENNPDVRIGDAEYEAATHETRHTRGQRLPSVQLQGGYTHSRHPQRVIPPKQVGQTSYFTKDIVSSNIVMRLPLFTGGQIVNEIRAAELMEAAAEHQLARTREELVFNVSSLYFSLLSQRKVIASVEFSMNAMEEHLEQVGHLIEAQKAAEVDRLRSEVRYADLRRQHVEEKNRSEIQLRTLSNLMGLHEPLRDPDLLAGELSAPDAPLDIETGLRTAFDARPDYLARTAEFEAQARRLGARRAARMPNLSRRRLWRTLGHWRFRRASVARIQRTYTVARRRDFQRPYLWPVARTLVDGYPRRPGIAVIACGGQRRARGGPCRGCRPNRSFRQRACVRRWAHLGAYRPGTGKTTRGRRTAAQTGTANPTRG